MPPEDVAPPEPRERHVVLFGILLRDALPGEGFLRRRQQPLRQSPHLFQQARLARVTLDFFLDEHGCIL